MLKYLYVLTKDKPVETHDLKYHRLGHWILMQFFPLYQTDPYTNPGSWLLLLLILDEQREAFQ